MEYDVNEVAKHYSQKPQELSQLVFKLGLLIADSSNAAEFELDATGDSPFDDEKDFKATLSTELVEGDTE